MAAVNYGAVRRWMELAIWAAAELNKWQQGEYFARCQGQLYTLKDDKGKVCLFRQIAEHAAQEGFSLRFGNRVPTGFVQMLEVIDPSNDLVQAFYRVDRESWLTPVGKGDSA